MCVCVCVFVYIPYSTSSHQGNPFFNLFVFTRLILLEGGIDLMSPKWPTTQGRQRPQGFLPQLDEFYFTTAEK
jgi:hypothetical protein